MKSCREADFAAFSRVWVRVCAWVWSNIGTADGWEHEVGEEGGEEGTPRRMLERKEPVKRAGSWDTRERWVRYWERGIVRRGRDWKRIWPFWGV